MLPVFAVTDGANTYTWDARNHLVAITGGVSASFQYDPLGRRVSKSAGGSMTSYLYDGNNTVQELSGGSPVANLVNAGLDQILTRTDAAGARSFLTDVLGSPIALADAAGSVQTEYSYDPFGQTTATGASSTNQRQYTGRENDGTGLYYYRARYYSPTLARFISEDPIGLRGGQANFYAYAGNDGLNYIDPFGTSAFYVHWEETYNAARAVGFPVSDAWHLADDVANADFRPGSQAPTADAANGHGMGGTLGGRKDREDRPQTPCEAFHGTADHLATADLAGALHAIEDSYVHGYTNWNGGSYGHWPGWAHFYKDLWYNSDAEAAAEAYIRTLGNGINPAGYLSPKPRGCS